MTNQGQGKPDTPPGQDPNRVPPGQDPNRVPPGQDPDFVPPGQDKPRVDNDLPDEGEEPDAEPKESDE